MAELTGREKKIAELRRTIEAGARWLNELQWQRDRLQKGSVEARTDEEIAYHNRLLEGYTVAARYSSVLLKFHRGRLDKMVGGDDPGEEMPTGILTDGRVAPVFEEDE
jgi:hypothetical protein